MVVEKEDLNEYVREYYGVYYDGVEEVDSNKRMAEALRECIIECNDDSTSHAMAVEFENKYGDRLEGLGKYSRVEDFGIDDFVDEKFDEFVSDEVEELIGITHRNAWVDRSARSVLATLRGWY